MKRIIYSLILTSALALPAMTVHAQTMQDSATGTSTLMSGTELDSGTVENLQQQLSNRGYYQGKPDGRWNDSTMKALNRYEQENGGTVQSNGMLNTTTLETLGVHQQNRATVSNNSINTNNNAATNTAPKSTVGGNTTGSVTLDGGIGGGATLDGGIGGNHSIGGVTLRTTTTNRNNNSPNTGPAATTSTGTGRNTAGSIGGSTSGSVSGPAGTPDSAR